MRKNKKFLILLIRKILSFFYLFKLKENRIFFVSNGGKSFNCNPKYLYFYLKEMYGEKLDFIWCLDKPEKYRMLLENTKIVRPRTILYYFYLINSKIVISNTGFSSEAPKRKGQYYVNTWHGGGAYKKVGLDTFQNETEIFFLEDAGNRTDLFLSSCRMFSNIMKTARHVDINKFLNSGMPRNDIFFTNHMSAIKRYTKKRLGVENKNVVLFAPTYRGQEQDPKGIIDIDVDTVLNSLKKRFEGKWCMLIKKHPFDKNSMIQKGIDVSDYEDMQELLCIADVLITDYSSSMWDFSFTGNPCFIFAPDIYDYEKSRGLYTPIEK